MTYTYYLDGLNGPFTEDHTFNSINKMKEHLSFMIRSSSHVSVIDVKYQGTNTSVKNYNERLKQYYGQ